MTTVKALKTATFLLMVASIHPSLGDEDSSMMFDNHPVYTYAYQVADDFEQTYITKQESRDGDTVTGSYSYVNPSGSLVTVNYRAGPQGYSETRQVQENFVTIRARPDTLSNINILEARRQEQTFTPPATPAPVQFIDNPAPLFKNIQFQDISAQPEETEPDLVNVVVEQITPVVSDVVFTESTLARSGPIDSSDLVAQIIAQLTPLIQETVSTTLTSRAQSRQVSASNLPLVLDSNVQN